MAQHTSTEKSSMPLPLNHRVKTSRSTDSAVDVTIPELAFDTDVYGMLSASNTASEYQVTLTQPTKLTATLVTASTLDADIYIFDEALNLVATSQNEGLGIAEITSCVLPAGAYSILVYDYEGSGLYLINAYASTQDITYELNDTFTTATALDSTFYINANIDTPYDVDIYSTNISSNTIININFNDNNQGYTLYLTNGTNIYDISSGVSAVQLDTGKWYFYVCSENGTYSPTTTYSLSLKNLYRTDLYNIAYNKDYQSYLQYEITSPGVYTYYLNGKEIDMTYSYEHHVSNSAGWINTYIGVAGQAGRSIVIGKAAADNAGVEPPIWGTLRTNSETRLSGNNSTPVLSLYIVENTDVSNTYLAYVRRYTGGEYKYTTESCSYTTPAAQIVIDLNTAKIVDVLTPNFYYDYGYRNGYVAANNTTTYLN